MDSIERALRHALKDTGHRFTEQRAAVYRFLSGTDTHPTAEEIYLAVRRDSVPEISLATVYSSLETLVSLGLVLKLAYGSDPAHYDGRTDPHHHARCLECGRIFDVPGRPVDDELDRLEASLTDFRVTSRRLELIGHCTDCGSPAGPPKETGELRSGRSG